MLTKLRTEFLLLVLGAALPPPAIGAETMVATPLWSADTGG